MNAPLLNLNEQSTLIELPEDKIETIDILVKRIELYRGTMNRSIMPTASISNEEILSFMKEIEDFTDKQKLQTMLFNKEIKDLGWAILKGYTTPTIFSKPWLRGNFQIKMLFSILKELTDIDSSEYIDLAIITTFIIDTLERDPDELNEECYIPMTSVLNKIALIVKMQLNSEDLHGLNIASLYMIRKGLSHINSLLLRKPKYLIYVLEKEFPNFQEFEIPLEWGAEILDPAIEI